MAENGSCSQQEYGGEGRGSAVGLYLQSWQNLALTENKEERRRGLGRLIEHLALRDARVGVFCHVLVYRLAPCF